MILDAQTEVVRINGLRPDSSSIWLESTRESTTESCLNEVWMSPGVGAGVRYSATADGSIRVRTYGDWSVQSATTEITHYSDFREYVIASKNTYCKHSAAVRLPLNGYLEVGSEQFFTSSNNEMLLLTDAALTLYGRAISKILGKIPLDSGPFNAHSLYLADVLAVPAGSRISGAKAADGLPARWWGFVNIEFSDQRGNMHAKATTNATSVNVFAPSPSAGDIGEPDRFRLTSGIRFTNDPNLLWIYSILGLVALLLGIIQE